MPGTEILTDVSAARWIEEELLGRELGGRTRVEHFVPHGFESYARILHPVHGPADDVRPSVAWSDVADWSGRNLVPTSPFSQIAQRPDGAIWPSRPEDGTLPFETCARLIGLLEPATTTPDVCWFCLWDGWGVLDLPTRKLPPRVRGPFSRWYLLYRGPVAAAANFRWGPAFHSPNIWWPEDRAWCVVTEIDARSTYVGGTKDLVARMLQSDQLEAVPAKLDDPLDGGGDPRGS